MIKKMIIFIALLAFFGCENAQTETFKGELFFSISDNFEEGTATKVYELKESGTNQVREIIFKDGEAPESLQNSQGPTVSFKGTLLKDGSILYLGPAKE